MTPTPKERKHFIIIDAVDLSPLVHRILSQYSENPDKTGHLIMRLEEPPKIGSGGVSFVPFVSEGEPFDGYLHICNARVLLHGCSPNNTLGFHYTEEAQS
jgi:hypothetical protein